MNNDIYYRLREWMDQFGAGFGATESGVEIKILERLFTEEEAELYLACTEKLESVERISQRAGRDNADETGRIMERMADKGLLLSYPSKDTGRKPTHYAAAPWLPGILEFNTQKVDKELAPLIMQYFATGPEPKGNILRVVPVKEEIPVSQQVAPFDDVKEIIKSNDRILVAPCGCCELAEGLGMEIDQPREVCLLFGFFADAYADKGFGRWISQEEALEVLEKSEEAGLIHRPGDTVPTECICNCGKFCGGVIAHKFNPSPSEFWQSNYYAELDPSLCSGCETCVSRCLLGAIAMGQDEIAEIDLGRCIGCGLCATTCPTEAIRLCLKPEAERHTSPESNPIWRSRREYAEDIK